MYPLAKTNSCPKRFDDVQAMQADVIDYDEYLSDGRREGQYIGEYDPSPASWPRPWASAWR